MREGFVTNRADSFEIVEEPLWFGPEERPLFGWLAMPVGGLTRGGVLCAPPIGREARAGRNAMRCLATSLAARGFVTLRFDYDGTGDSSGGFNDIGRDTSWINSVVEATHLLRSLGVESVSAVGMRLGATLIGVAADKHELDLSSVVLWDPCESGRSYLRELNALETIRRDEIQALVSDSIETSEFVYSLETAEEIRRLNLSKTTSSTFGQRTLVIARSDRAVPARLRAHLRGETINWQSTNQQSSLLDVDPSWAALPHQTIARIVRWLSDSDAAYAPIERRDLAKAAVVTSGESGHPVRERCVEIGPERLFGIVTEPTTDQHGPLLVMFNVANEEHTGPSRLWVELSRRWASFGLRSVRFDLRGLGDSPWRPGQSETPFFVNGWFDDIVTVARELSPDDPSNTVFIGLCSGAYWAIEAALSLGARGVCAINPPVYIDYLHSVRPLEGSRNPLLRRIGKRLKDITLHRWIAAAAWHIVRSFVPSRWAVDLLEELEHKEIDILLLYSVEEIWPFRVAPIFRSIDVQRLPETNTRQIEFIPGLDHGMHFADGRTQAVGLLDQHVLEHFGGGVLSAEAGSVVA
jgi:pimeloyl-ACP methyl ester carboxylesterase